MTAESPFFRANTSGHAATSKKKRRRGGTPRGARPRRLTRQRAPRTSRVALHL